MTETRRDHRIFL